ncbi:hypothetical protein LWJ10_003965 [Salmonella enterica]|nr:hypothetical protein [Salmonella enterica]EIJ8452214.1 hypothetical protein [Salmonella enterica]EIR1186422.1 hypothetical protein [Salmonella enterica]
MFIRKSQHNEICGKLRNHIIMQDWKFERFEHSYNGGGGPYKRIIECREIAKSVNALPDDERRVLLHRLAYIDAWLNRLIPLMTERMKPCDKEAWDRALSDIPAESVYGDAWHYFQPGVRG